MLSETVEILNAFDAIWSASKDKKCKVILVEKKIKSEKNKNSFSKVKTKRKVENLFLNFVTEARDYCKYK